VEYENFGIYYQIFVFIISAEDIFHIPDSFKTRECDRAE
jgi:hypothetical protein